MRARVAAATVKFLRRGGQGVLVPGHLISSAGSPRGTSPDHLLFTAAHVIGWSAKGYMALGDDARFVEGIATATGVRLLAYPLAVEPVADIAVLGALDGQWHPDAEEAYEAFCEQTTPVPVDTTDFHC
jgi:hypothetical protein